MAPTWYDEFEMSRGSYSVSDIKKYFAYIFREKHNEKFENPPIGLYAKKTKNRITFKTKTGYYLELLTPGTMKLLGSTENKITKVENGENVPHIEITEVVFVYCNIAGNDYQQSLRVLYTFVPNKSFGILLKISPKNNISLKTFNSEFQDIRVYFTGQNNHPLEIEDRIDLTLMIK